MKNVRQRKPIAGLGWGYRRISRLIFWRGLSAIPIALRGSRRNTKAALLDACYDRGSTFRVKCCLNDGAP